MATVICHSSRGGEMEWPSFSGWSSASGIHNGFRHLWAGQGWAGGGGEGACLSRAVESALGMAARDRHPASCAAPTSSLAAWEGEEPRDRGWRDGPSLPLPRDLLPAGGHPPFCSEPRGQAQHSGWGGQGRCRGPRIHWSLTGLMFSVHGLHSCRLAVSSFPTHERHTETPSD